MKDHVKGAFITAVGLTVFMSTLPPALIGGTDGAVWHFIEKFQTLITGLLAVGAAFWTVMEMRISQTKQEQQHRAQLAVATLTQKLAILRLVDMVTPFLNAYPDSCHQYLRLQRSMQPWTNETCNALATWLLSTETLKRLVHGDLVNACQPLFTPPVSLCLKQIEASLEFIVVIGAPNIDQIAYLWKSEVEPPWHNDGFPAAAEDLSNQVTELIRQLDIWCELMIGERFRIGV